MANTVQEKGACSAWTPVPTVFSPFALGSQLGGLGSKAHADRFEPVPPLSQFPIVDAVEEDSAAASSKEGERGVGDREWDMSNDRDVAVRTVPCNKMGDRKRTRKLTRSCGTERT